MLKANVTMIDLGVRESMASLLPRLVAMDDCIINLLSQNDKANMLPLRQVLNAPQYRLICVLIDFL